MNKIIGKKNLFAIQYSIEIGLDVFKQFLEQLISVCKNFN
jgi:hypothetical protein